MDSYVVGYSIRYIDEDGTEMLCVSSDFEAHVEKQKDLTELFKFVLSEFEGKIQTLTFTLKEKS